MVSCKAFNLPLNHFCLIFIVTHLSVLPWSIAADSAALIPRKGGVLQVLVPAKTGFKEFVDCSDNSNVKGFCIDVFKNALSILYPKPNWTGVNYTCYPIGNKSYDTMINQLASRSEEYDAVVGDVTVSAARLVNVNFTQTYLDSGIVIVAPDKGISRNFPGVFYDPFTNETWAILVVSILLAGLALWLLEHNEQQSLQRAPSRLEQFKRIFWFVTSILIFFKRDSIKNPLAKFVMIAWILFILLLGSSYTASLSSILTVDQLSQKSLTMENLADMNAAVGYQVGSIVEDYLRKKHIKNLKVLYNTTQYAKALRSKEVVAVVDEIPYISLFLAAQSASNCKFSVSHKLTIEGLGFAFHNKSLSEAFSVAILNLSESGQMQMLQDGWKLSNFQCPSRVQSIRLDLESSQGLFVLLGAAMFLCMAIFMLKHHVIPCSIRAYTRFGVNQRQDAIGAFQEPNFYRSIRRFLSAKHDLTPGELTV